MLPQCAGMDPRRDVQPLQNERDDDDRHQIPEKHFLHDGNISREPGKYIHG